MSGRARPVRPGDADALRAIDAEGFESYRAFAPPGWEPPSTEVPVELATAPGVIWLTVDRDGAPAGSVLIVPVSLSREPLDDPKLAHLMHLFVMRSRWGSDVATVLHADALRAARAEGFERGRLFCAADHGRARRFYEREGWSAVRRIEETPIGLPMVEYRRDLRAP